MTWVKFTQLPAKSGRYWLYGKIWGDTRPELYIIDIVKIASGYLHTCRGSGLFKTDVEGDFFITPLHDPELPNDKNVASN